MMTRFSSYFKAALVAVALIILFFPGTLLMQKTPMGSTSAWEQAHPIDGFATFIPAYNIIRHEALHHNNMLWSNLKGMGFPILSSEIQGAPLFPLTQLLIFLPGSLFWNLLILIRLFLMGMATYLLATEIMKFRRESGIVFVFAFVYATFILRYINHPWTNGLCAGLWYIYFVCHLLKISPQKWGSGRGLIVLLTSLSVYSVVTCGFPESGGMVGLLSLIIFVPIIVIDRKSIHFRHFLLDIGLSHLPAVALASPQILAFLEHLQLLQEGFRDSHWLGMHQFPSFNGLYHLITPFLKEGLYFEDAVSIPHFGLIVSWLFLNGLWEIKSHRNRWDLIALLTISVYILKAFPLWPLFNEMMARIPIISQSWFQQFYIPLLVWGLLTLWLKAVKRYGIPNRC